MSGFVNDSLSNLISSLNVTVLTRSAEGRIVYSKFNLKVLLFLAARGFLSDIRVVTSGSGGLIYYKFVSSDSGSPIISRVFTPLIKKSKRACLTKYVSFRSLLSIYSSEFVLVTTNKGLMTANEAVALGLGGVIVLIII
jgi:ribosomal protein S8